MRELLAYMILTLMFIFIGIPILGKVSMHPMRQSLCNYSDFFIKGLEVLFYISLAILGFFLVIWSLTILGA